MSRTTRILLPVVAWLLVPAPGSAQQPEQVQEWQAELRQVEVRLAGIQQQALEDEALSERQAEVTAAVRAAMIAADPAMEAQLERLSEIIMEARAAQAAGDAERVAALTTEAQSIQPAVAEAQADAMQRPEIAEQVEAFQGELHARMAEIDPEAQALLARRMDLVNRIRAAGGGA